MTATASVREQAARWFTRLNGAGRTTDDATLVAWRAWMDAAPAHAREYAVFESLWRDFDATPRVEALAQALQQQRRMRRRTAVKGMLGVAGLGLAGLLARQGWDAWQNGTTYAGEWHAGIGERLALALPDGSHITLGPASNAALRYSRRQRTVALLGGEALFDVARDGDRPFSIDAGTARVTVLGTRFVVSRLPGLVRVSVAHGTVQLAPHDGQGPLLLLNAGDVGELPNGSAAPQRVPRDARDAFSAAERGLIVFDQASLAEIAATLSRWRRQPVRAEAGAEASQDGPRITAAVQARDVEGFLQSLPKIAAVRVQERDGATWLAMR